MFHSTKYCILLVRFTKKLRKDKGKLKDKWDTLEGKEKGYSEKKKKDEISIIVILF